MKLLRESLVMDPEIIDNFLPSSQFEKIQSYMIGDGNFPWFYNNGIVDEDDGLSQLIHLFYHPKGTISRCYSLILPILTKLRVSDIYKIKANLIPRTEFRRKTRYHIDGDGLCCGAGEDVCCNDEDNDSAKPFNENDDDAEKKFVSSIL